MSNPIIKSDNQYSAYIYQDLCLCDLENPKCENCGKELENSQSTHCSDKCLFDSIKNSQAFTVEDAKDNSSATNSY